MTRKSLSTYFPSFGLLSNVKLCFMEPGTNESGIKVQSSGAGRIGLGTGV